MFSQSVTNMVTYLGFAWLIRRVLDLMIELIGPLYNWLQQFTSHYLTLHWKYSDFKLICQLKVKVTVQLTISLSVSLGVEPHLLYLWQLRSCFSGAPSLTRKRVCFLYMLLVLANVVFLGSESLGTSDQILLSQIWDFPFRRLLRLAGSRWRYSNSPSHGWTVIVDF
jgi:hypothetical protein